MSFHKPKKDQCSTCTIYNMKKMEGKLGEEEQESQKQHLSRKERAREEKEKDKEAARKDPSKHVVTVDLQAVLQAPCTNVSQLYYKRKLCTTSRYIHRQMVKVIATSGMRRKDKGVHVKSLRASTCTCSHCQVWSTKSLSFPTVAGDKTETKTRQQLCRMQ